MTKMRLSADLVEKLETEIKIVDKYLPEQLSDDEVRLIVQEIIDEVGAESMKDMGTVMSSVMPKVQGRADGGKILRISRRSKSRAISTLPMRRIARISTMDRRISSKSRYCRCLSIRAVASRRIRHRFCARCQN